MKNIKVQVNGYLKSLNDNNTTIIDTKGIKNNNEILYVHDNIKHKIILNEDEIVLIRENDEFKNVLEFNIHDNKQSYFLLKENNLEIYVNIKTNKLLNHNKVINIEYEVLDSSETYEYKIEVR